ncbi:MAG: hypothetical protein JXA06_04215 [Bacteroidetes bacterium]|nr:hypothetical protein [Bacteroidota bacterium]
MLDTLRKDGTITSWLTHCEASDDARLLSELPLNNPEETWCIIFKILQRPESETHLTALSDCLKKLIIYHSEEFIDCVEAQAMQNSRFKACLSRIHSYPETRISVKMLERLRNATGFPIELVAASPESLPEHAPDLSGALYATPIPLGTIDAGSFTENDMDRIARSWLKYQETLWAWEKVNNIVKEEFIEYAYNVVKSLYEKSSSDIHLSSIGAGPLESLLKKNGIFIMDRIEQLASTDKRFRICLSYIWPTNISIDLWKRILRARADEPQRK